MIETGGLNGDVDRVEGGVREALGCMGIETCVRKTKYD